MRRSIEIDDTELAREVLGTRDSHLRRVREVLGVSAVFRGGKLTVEGGRDEVERAASALGEMKRVAGAMGGLTPEEVARILNAVSMEADEEDAPSLRTAATPGLDQEGPASSGPPDSPASTVDEGAGGAATQRTPRGRTVLTERLIVGGGRKVEARTAGQSHYIRTMRGNEITFCAGPAGTGKTYLAVAHALSALEAGLVNRIALARPAVEAGERLGFLPGDERQKVNPYLRPLYDALTDMMSYSELGRLTDRGAVEIVPLAYMRGRTLARAFVILDEAQNTTPGQMLMFLTRLGVRSRAVVTGDITQIDLPDPSRSGLVQACRILDGVEGIGIVHLSERDIVRHRLVRSIVAAYGAACGGASGSDR